MRSIIIILYLVIFFTVSLPFLIFNYLILFINKQLAYKYCNIVAKVWAKVLLFLAGTKITVNGLDNIPNAPVLFVSNHRSWFDIPAIYSYLPHPTGFVAKKEIRKVPILSQWMKCIDCLFIDRENIREGLKTILLGIDLLKNGHSLVIFPEGTRSKQDDMLPFKQGSLKLAERANVPIIPISIKNSDNILEKNGLNVKSARVVLTFGDPIYLNELDSQDKKASALYVQQIIQNMLD